MTDTDTRTAQSAAILRYALSTDDIDTRTVADVYREGLVIATAEHPDAYTNGHAIAAAKRADDDAHALSVSYARGALISTDCELTRAHHDNFVAAVRLQRALVDHSNAFDAYVAALDSSSTDTERN